MRPYYKRHKRSNWRGSQGPRWKVIYQTDFKSANISTHISASKSLSLSCCFKSQLVHHWKLLRHKVIILKTDKETESRMYPAIIQITFLGKQIIHHSEKTAESPFTNYFPIFWRNSGSRNRSSVDLKASGGDWGQLDRVRLTHVNPSINLSITSMTRMWLCVPTDIM